MFVEGLKHYPHIPLIAFASLIFVAAFVGIVGGTYLKREKLNQAAQLPLADEETGHG